MSIRPTPTVGPKRWWATRPMTRRIIIKLSRIVGSNRAFRTAGPESNTKADCPQGTHVQNRPSCLPTMSGITRSAGNLSVVHGDLYGVKQYDRL